MKYRLTLTSEQAEQLYDAFENGVFKDFGVSEVALIAPSTTATIELPENDAFGKEVDLSIPGQIVRGRVLRIANDEVWIDIGRASEGVVPLREWHDDTRNTTVPPKVGDTIEVLMDAARDAPDRYSLSYRDVKLKKQWDQFFTTHKKGDVVTGTLIQQIKNGGWTIDIGIKAQLIDTAIKKCAYHVNETIKCKILIVEPKLRRVIVHPWFTS